MRIKNTKELRLRAAAHVREDHIKQGTYGDVKRNGKKTFVACAIGCLSTPHRLGELSDFLEEVAGYWSGNEATFTITDDEQRERLAEEFGINSALAMAAEGFFEGQVTHGAAIQFVKQFADALVEGAEITPYQVREWLKSHLGCRGHYLHGDGSWYEEVENSLAKYDTGYVDSKRVSIKTAEFLDWLRGRKPAVA